MKFVFVRTLTILSWDNPVTAFFRKSKNCAIALTSHRAAILFSVVFVLIGLLFPEEDFLGCFLYFLILGQGLNLFDLLVIDLLWWRNSKRTEIEGLDADRELYSDPGKHVDAFYRGILMFLCVAFISAVVLRPKEIYIFFAWLCFF